MKKILVISPHPDDESIGCGGTIRKHVVDGDIVHVIFLTSGEKGGHGNPEEETIRIRDQEATMAAEVLGIHQIEFWKQPDGIFKASKKNVERLQEKLRNFTPQYVYAPHLLEAHPDHQQAFHLCRKAISTISMDALKPTLLLYEVWTPITQIYRIVDISEFVEDKKRAINAHKSQTDVLKFDDAIMGLNRYRGEMFSWPGGDFAEVFEQMDFDEKQKIEYKKKEDVYVKYYDRNSKLLRKQRELYPIIRYMKYVPQMEFSNTQIFTPNSGRSLHWYHQNKSSLTAEEKKKIKVQLIDFVQALHKLNLAHRDLHVGNICWDGRQIWIIDWDFAANSQAETILRHYDLTGTGLESPSETNYVCLFKRSYGYCPVNEVLAPVPISINDFAF